MHSVGIVTTFDCNRHNSRQKWLVFEPFAGFLLSAFTLSPFGWARYPFLPEHMLHTVRTTSLGCLAHALVIPNQMSHVSDMQSAARVAILVRIKLQQDRRATGDSRFLVCFRR